MHCGLECAVNSRFSFSLLEERRQFTLQKPAFQHRYVDTFRGLSRSAYCLPSSSVPFRRESETVHGNVEKIAVCHPHSTCETESLPQKWRSRGISPLRSKYGASAGLALFQDREHSRCTTGRHLPFYGLRRYNMVSWICLQF